MTTQVLSVRVAVGPYTPVFYEKGKQAAPLTRCPNRNSTRGFI